MLVFAACISFVIGLLISSYCRLYLALRNITDSWALLVGHALKKREALVSLCRLSTDPTVRMEYLDRLLQEELFLKQCITFKHKAFLKQAREVILTFHEMEVEFLRKAERLYEQLNFPANTISSHEQFREFSEDFLAADNLFSFETMAFEQAVEKYEDLRTKPILQLGKEIFRFSSIPEVKFSR